MGDRGGGGRDGTLIYSLRLGYCLSLCVNEGRWERQGEGHSGGSRKSKNIQGIDGG